MTTHSTYRKPLPPTRLKGGLGHAPSSPLISPNKIQPARKLLALDTETTGTDFYHGCRPFFVSMLDFNSNITTYEWDVNPFTREVVIPAADTVSLSEIIKEHDLLMHNTKFDVRALESSGFPLPHWDTVQDTLIASHVLVSNESHKLKDLALHYLDIMDDDQRDLMEATNMARRYARQWGWRLANEGDPHFPAQRRPENGWWMLDTWMPRAVCQRMYYNQWNTTLSGHPLIPTSARRSRSAAPTSPNHEWRPPGTDGPDDPGHPWWTVLRTYAIRDVERTLGLWLLFKDEMQQQGLMELYEERRQLLQPVYEMEDNGATLSENRRSAMVTRLEKEGSLARRECLRICRKAGVIADDKTLSSPKQLSALLYGTFKLKPGKMSKATADALARGESLAAPGQGRIAPPEGSRKKKPTIVPELQYSTDADTLKNLLDRASGQPKSFITNLLKNRKCERTLAYIHEYTTRAIPAVSPDLGSSHAGSCVDAQLAEQTNDRKTRSGSKGTENQRGPVADQSISIGVRCLRYALLHGNFNITGTDTTRFSSSSPNLQNIGKQVALDPETKEIIADYNLRRIFGPTEGREWYSIDYSNIELRIFAYKSGDVKLIEAFEAGFSVHCIFAELIHPKEYAECREECRNKLNESHPTLSANSAEYITKLRKATENLFKTRYESTLYQWTKNGVFALIYGAGQPKADATFRVPGAYERIRNRMPLIDDFLQSKNLEARATGFVRCEGGIIAPGRKSHITLGNSPVISPQRNGYRLFVPQREPHVAVNYYIQGTAGWCMIRAINRVHRYLTKLNKELGLTRQNGYKVIMTIHDELVFDFPLHDRNPKVISNVARLMEASGEDIGLPTPVAVERHPHNWAEGEEVRIAV